MGNYIFLSYCRFSGIQGFTFDRGKWNCKLCAPSVSDGKGKILVFGMLFPPVFADSVFEQVD